MGGREGEIRATNPSTSSFVLTAARNTDSGPVESKVRVFRCDKRHLSWRPTKEEKNLTQPFLIWERAHETSVRIETFAFAAGFQANQYIIGFLQKSPVEMRVNEKCFLHNQPFVLYCTQCKQLLCTTCLVRQHNGHIVKVSTHRIVLISSMKMLLWQRIFLFSSCNLLFHELRSGRRS